MDACVRACVRVCVRERETVVCWRHEALEEGEGGATVAGTVTRSIVGPITILLGCPLAAILRAKGANVIAIQTDLSLGDFTR